MVSIVATHGVRGDGYLNTLIVVNKVLSVDLRDAHWEWISFISNLPPEVQRMIRTEFDHVHAQYRRETT